MVHDQSCYPAGHPGASWERWVNPQHILALWVILPPVKDFIFSFAELHQIPLCPYLQPLEVPLNDSTTMKRISHSLWFVMSAKLLRVHSVPSYRSLMKRWNGIGHSVYNWGTSLLTYMDFVPLMTALWVQSFQQFSAHLTAHLSNPYFVCLSMMML